MASVQSAQGNENIPPQQTRTVVQSLLSNGEIICHFRTMREHHFNFKNAYLFQLKPLSLTAELPLPLPCLPHQRPTFKELSLEHLQDFCNKATIIYCTKDYAERSTPVDPQFEAMYKYILDKWSHGESHTTDIEFARFFGKLVEVWEASTTHDIVQLHEALCDGSDAAARKDGFYKELGGSFFKNTSQIDFYKIKPLCRALIMIIEDRWGDGKSQFEKQRVRLVRTGFTEGLSKPITFHSLSNLEETNENEVVVMLPEAMKFIMDLDEREEALRAPRDMNILDENLETPAQQIRKYFTKGKRIWTGGDPPTGDPRTWFALGMKVQKSEQEAKAKAKPKPKVTAKVATKVTAKPKEELKDSDDYAKQIEKLVIYEVSR